MCLPLDFTESEDGRKTGAGVGQGSGGGGGNLKMNVPPGFTGSEGGERCSEKERVWQAVWEVTLLGRVGHVTVR